MIKKFYLLLIICLLVTSCGKRGDPTYKEPTSKIPVYFAKYS